MPWGKKALTVGSPEPGRIGTSHVEWRNLAIRMQMRCFVRPGECFLQEGANHMHLVALRFMVYNFAGRRGFL